MKQSVFEIIFNRPLTAQVYEMCLVGDTSGINHPGQFVNIALDSLFLRRPISICDYDEHSLKLIYKVVGKGTQQMSKLEPGTQLDLLVGLGNGFTIDAQCRYPLLVGGGVGVPPLYRLAKNLIADGRKISVVLGFNTAEEVFFVDEFIALGASVHLATADGSLGFKGFVTDAIAVKGILFDYFYACGPLPMLRAVYDVTSCVDGQMSFEERMGCGFGVCMGCSCKTKNGYKRLCKEGPVLKKEEIIW